MEGSDRSLPRSLRSRYEILRQLGAGAFGRVVQARDLALDRSVAIKLLAVDDEGVRARFRREARVTAQLDHPGIVRVLDVGLTEEGVGDTPGQAWIVYEYLEGRSLEAVLRDPAGLAPRSVLAWAVAGAEALAAAHEAGVIHRDVKPANVMIRPDGRLVVCDFGLAAWTDAATVTRLTRTGSVVGTPYYLPPETWDGVAASPRGDQYAWGLVVFQLAYRSDPFRGMDFQERLARRLEGPRIEIPEAFRGRAPGFESALLRALEPVPDLRFPTMVELARALQAEGCGPGAGGRGGPAPARARELDGEASAGSGADTRALPVAAAGRRDPDLLPALGERPLPGPPAPVGTRHWRIHGPGFLCLLGLLMAGALAIGTGRIRGGVEPASGGTEVPRSGPVFSPAFGPELDALASSVRDLGSTLLGPPLHLPRGPTRQFARLQDREVVDALVDARFPVRARRYFDALEAWLEVLRSCPPGQGLDEPAVRAGFEELVLAPTGDLIGLTRALDSYLRRFSLPGAGDRTGYLGIDPREVLDIWPDRHGEFLDRLALLADRVAGWQGSQAAPLAVLKAMVEAAAGRPGAGAGLPDLEALLDRGEEPRLWLLIALDFVLAATPQELVLSCRDRVERLARTVARVQSEAGGLGAEDRLWFLSRALVVAVLHLNWCGDSGGPDLPDLAGRLVDGLAGAGPEAGPVVARAVSEIRYITDVQGFDITRPSIELPSLLARIRELGRGDGRGPGPTARLRTRETPSMVGGKGP